MSRVAHALNLFSDRVFLDTLSANDRAAMTDLVEFFCSAVDEEDEQGMH